MTAPRRVQLMFLIAAERNGRFDSQQGRGLIPGEYEATVYEMAAKWRSVWAELHHQIYFGVITVESSQLGSSMFTRSSSVCHLASRDRSIVVGMACRIMIVEDEPDIRDLIAITLRKQGHEVIEASCGEEAWEKAAELKPQLIVLDVFLPDMDGISLCEMFRRLPHTAKISIITAPESPGPKDWRPMHTQSADPSPRKFRREQWRYCMRKATLRGEHVTYR